MSHHAERRCARFLVRYISHSPLSLASTAPSAARRYESKATLQPRMCTFAPHLQYQTSNGAVHIKKE